MNFKCFGLFVIYIGLFTLYDWVKRFFVLVLWGWEFQLFLLQFFLFLVLMWLLEDVGKLGYCLNGYIECWIGWENLKSLCAIYGIRDTCRNSICRRDIYGKRNQTCQSHIGSNHLNISINSHIILWSLRSIWLNRYNKTYGEQPYSLSLDMKFVILFFNNNIKWVPSFLPWEMVKAKRYKTSPENKK